MPLAMLIFIDESGDTGFKLKTASSRFFVLTIVIFDDLETAEEANQAIKDLHTELKFSDDKEFKFSTGTSNKFKVEFLQKLAKYKFRYRSIVIDKQKLSKVDPKNPEDSLYTLVTDQLFLRAQDRIQNASLFVDRTAQSKRFIQKFNTYLKRKLNTDMRKLIGEVRHKDSKSNNLLQLADMVCGAIYRKYNKKDDKFYKLIKRREEDLWKPY